MAALRRLLFPVSYAGRRLAHRPGRLALVVVGIAGAAAFLAAVLAGSLIAQERELARALERQPPAERAVRAAWYGVPRQGAEYAVLDRAARQALLSLGPGEPIKAMQFRQTRIAGSLVDLGAVDGVGRWVGLSSGRLPRQCRPERCEVVQLGGSGPIPSVPGLRLDLVGRGRLLSSVPFGRLAPPGALIETPGARFVETPFAPEPPPFLLAEGVEGLVAAPELESIFRSYGWVAPVEPGSVPPWEVDGYARQAERARSRLKTASYLSDLTAPTGALEGAAEGGRIAARRLLLVGGEAAALVLGFALLAAVGLRRDHDSALRRMTWYGGKSWQLGSLSAVEAVAVAIAATALGWTLGAAAALLIARQAGSPAADVLLHSVLAGGGFAAAGLLAAFAALVLILALRARPLRLGGISLSLADAAAVAALLALAVGFLRGEADVGALGTGGGTGVFLLLLPGLAGLVAAVLLARAVSPAFRLLERLARAAPLGARLAALSLARRPGRASLVAAFLTVSLGLALFAATYRATLANGQRDQARFAVPLDFVVRAAPAVAASPFDIAPRERFERLATGGAAVPVVRFWGSVSRLATGGVTLLGIPPAELTRLEGWREDFASLPPSELARRIAPARPVSLRGPRIPKDATALVLRAAAEGDDVVLVASVLTETGQPVHLELGETEGSAPTILTTRLPEHARGGRLVGLTIGLTALSRETGEPLEGVLTLGDLRVSRKGGTSGLLSDYRDWVGVNGIERAEGCCGTVLPYFVTNQVNSRFRPRQQTDGSAVPAIVSPRLARAAGPGGILPVERVGQQLPVRVVAVARRFPSVDGDFVVTDGDVLVTASNAEVPGSARANEVWLRVPAVRAAEVAAALRRPPFAALEARSRRALEQDLREAPLARATLLTLAAAAAAGLALALAGLALAVLGDLRDERGELFDLEAEGAEPAFLRRHVYLRASFSTAIGLAGGLALGVILTALVTDLVSLTAGGARPEPPLLLRFDWTLALLATAAWLAAGAALAAGLTWAAFRSEVPGRMSVEAL